MASRKLTIKEIAMAINDSPAPEESREMLATLGITGEDATNAALYVASVFKEACNGNQKAADRWETFIKPDVVELSEATQTALEAVLSRRACK